MLKKTIVLILLVFLNFLNFILSEYSLFGTIFSLVQVSIVTFFLIQGRITKAFFLHLIFIVTSLNINFVSPESSDQFVPFNYSKLKIFDIIPVVLILNAIFLFLLKNKYNKLPSLSKFIRHYVILNLVAVSFGIYGLIFLNYSVHFFITYLYYSLIVFTTLVIFNKSSSYDFYQFFDRYFILLLAASPLSSALFYYFGNSSYYGGIETIPVNSVFIFTPFLFLTSNKVNFIIKIFVFPSFFLVSIYSTGGKGVVFIVILVIFYFFKKLNEYKISRYLFYGGIVFLVTLINSNDLVIKDKNEFLMAQKFNQFVSVFQGSLEEVSTSPQVRLGEVANIIYSYKINPLKSFLGVGYGGYFEDYLGLFKYIDLSKGSFDDEQINSGRYYRPHDSIPVILLLHGIFGILFLVFWMVYIFKFASRANNLLGVIPWLVLTYGFDINIAIVGIFFLYLGLFDVQEPSTVELSNSNF